MIKIPIRETHFRAGAELYVEIETFLLQHLGQEYRYDNDVADVERRWYMSRWPHFLMVVTDPEIETFLALKYGVVND